MTQIVMDITSSACWTGPVVGIIRAETELARWAVTKANATCVVYDWNRHRFRRVKDAWLEKLLDERVALETWGAPAIDPQRPRKSDSVPTALRPALEWLRIRRKFLSILEHYRLTNVGSMARFAEAMQPLLMSTNYRRRMFLSKGVRRDLPSYDLALDDGISVSKETTFVCAGSSWANKNSAALAALKQAYGCRIVNYCYDIIPLQFPDWYKSYDVECFREHYHKVVPISDLMIFSAERIKRDAIAYCQQHSLPIKHTAVVPLGSDFGSRKASRDPLPSSLARSRFILFVSTIEPRKGHQTLCDVWLRLIAAGVVDGNFKLVFVGRWGWKIEELKAALYGDPRLKDHIVILSDASDRLLDTLYRECLFCVYPSIYEGFGLPVIEAFSYGKAVVASDGGALKEVVGRFSPTLSPRDLDGWYNKLAEWITDPSERLSYEQRIARDYIHRSWSAAASDLLDHVLATSKSR